MFTDDDVFVSEILDPGNIILRSLKKLRTMWKVINAEYKQAVSRFTQSGTHDDSFYGYCQGKKDVYYLPCCLNIKPSLNKMVIADLPEKCNVASSDTSSDSNNNGNNNNSAEKLKCKQGNDLLIEAIKESNNNKMNHELAYNKILFMKEQTERNSQELKMKNVLHYSKNGNVYVP
jgi:hypothetical protein